MRPARFRFTIRRSMALVAWVATLMGSGIMVKRLMQLHRVYQERASRHDQEEQNARFLLSHMADVMAPYKEARREIKEVDARLDPEAQKRLKELMQSDPVVQEVASGEIQEEKLLEEMMRPLEEFMKVASSEVDYHAQRKRKYERAAARSWLSVSPDDEGSEVDLWEMYLKAMERSESKAAEIDRLPLPPRLQIIEPEPPSRKYGRVGKAQFLGRLPPAGRLNKRE